jgi:GGDEF domain-containing protein
VSRQSHRVAVTDRSARSRRPALSSVGIVALVGGLFGSWLNIPYFRVGSVSAGVLDLPGGSAYGVAMAAFVIGVVCGGDRRRAGRSALLVLAIGLAAYSGFWLGGALIIDLNSSFSLSHPSFGFGLLLSFAGSVLSVLAIQAQAARRATPSELTLPKETGSPSSELASCEEFLDRLRALSSGGTDHQAVPLVFVRADGLAEVRSRYGWLAADRISVALTHRLRAHLRGADTVVRFLPGEVFIILSGGVSEENAMVVVRRLEATLAKPIPSVKRRHAKLLTITVQLAKSTLKNGRIHVVVDHDHHAAVSGLLIDAPIGSADAPVESRILDLI